MIRLKKIKSLKERVQLRKCGEVFHLLSRGEDSKERDAIFSHLLTLLSDEEKEKAEYFYARGRYDDIYYLTLNVLGESPADWDFIDEHGNIDFSKRTVFPHILYLDSLRSPFNVGSIFRSSEAFGVEQIFLRPGSADPRHPRSLKSSKGCVDAIDYSFKELEEMDLECPVFALEVGGKDISEFIFPEKGICIIGNEESGISPGALKIADNSLGRVSIRQYGAKGSINVSSAAAIMLSAWANSSAKMRKGV